MSETPVGSSVETSVNAGAGDSAPGENSAPVDGRQLAALAWRTSSFSGGGHGGGESIQVAAEGDLVFLRESDRPEKVVVTTRTKWDAFVRGVQAGEFDSYIQ